MQARGHAVTDTVCAKGYTGGSHCARRSDDGSPYLGLEGVVKEGFLREAAMKQRPK